MASLSLTPTRKRKAASDSSLEEIDLSSIREGKGLSIHGMMTQLSPEKTSRKDASCKYFDCIFSNGKKQVRAVSFNVSLRKEIEELTGSREGTSSRSICVKNCDVKNGDEIVMTSKTTIYPSNKEFPHGHASGLTVTSIISISDISDMAVGQEVSVNVKVVVVGDIVDIVSKKCPRILRSRIARLLMGLPVYVWLCGSRISAKSSKKNLTF